MSALPTLPAGVLDLLSRERVPFPEACAFLGISRQAGHPKATRYLRRIERERRKAEMAGRALERKLLIPRRDAKTGEFTEIPCYRASHKIMARADFLVPMAYPEVAWP